LVIVSIAVLKLIAVKATVDSATDANAPASGMVNSAEFREPVLRNAIHILGNLEEFDQQVALDQVVDRLNQWVHLQKFNVDWKPDPFMDTTLPKRYADSPWVAQLPDDLFNHEMDGDFLKEATWLRDISNANRGDKLDDLSTAEKLFDWTVRNIQLVEPQPHAAEKKQVDITPLVLGRHSVGDILMLGYGTGLQRSWIFTLLARQQGLDVVLLAVPDPDHPDQFRPWLPALLHKNGDGEELYLFDSSLGLPIPGPGGKGIATLAEACDKPAVLDHLDLDESHHYPVKAAEAKQAVALIEASPDYLARRMKILEMQLAGSERLVLSSSPVETAARLKKVSRLKSEPKLWTWPYEVLALRSADAQAPQGVKDVFVMEESPFLLPAYHGDRRVQDPGAQEEAFNEAMKEGDTEMAADEAKRPDKETKEERDQRRAARSKRPLKVFFPLWVGRLLQFRGEYGGERGAKHFYIECRPGDDQIGEWVQELVNDFREPNQRPPVQRYAAAMLRRKQDATYWLGLISFDEHEYETAEEYFKNLTLDVWPHGGPWNDGARYNLARSYEAAGRLGDAIKLYAADDSPQRHGNHLRARWLQETAATKKATAKAAGTAGETKMPDSKTTENVQSNPARSGAKKDEEKN
jgi:tetratricopeptide (TPR) repeat protein